jgi:hypothetical protein
VLGFHFHGHLRSSGKIAHQGEGRRGRFCARDLQISRDWSRENLSSYVTYARAPRTEH